MAGCSKPKFKKLVREFHRQRSRKNHSECDQQGVHHRRILRSEKQADRFLRQADRTEKSCSPDKSIRGYNSQISSLQTGHLRRRSAAERPRIIGLKLGNCRQSQLSRLHDRNPEENRTFFTVRAFIRLRRYAQRTDGSDGFRSTLHIDRLQRWGREISDKNGTNGLLTPIGDVEALQTAMEKILSDQFFADNLSHNAHKLCETHSPEKYTQNGKTS